MAGTKMTYLICFDDHRNFTDDIRKRFSDNTRYTVLSFITQSDFTEHFIREKENKSCKVAIIGVPDVLDNYDLVEKLTSEIKKSDPMAGIILLINGEKLELVKKAVRTNIDAYIPRNSNSILRIHNTVKRLISIHNISTFRKKRNLALYVLLSFILLSVLILVISFFKAPQYF
ncbi:MAG: hypothetical protein GT600_06355 [Bacteroidales bacterium]|jgi:DNA-binding NarL/FixJ family response regulator|nr:hypothetical protein [Bacteroidales bacterium]HOU01346.1 hypothetical protein [Bacteroidales bacterium]HQK67429.1 hypothetical protein [Bacteroidales bacterium]